MRILHTEASCGWGGQEIRILTEARRLIGLGADGIMTDDPARMAPALRPR